MIYTSYLCIIRSISALVVETSESSTSIDNRITTLTPIVMYTYVQIVFCEVRALWTHLVHVTMFLNNGHPSVHAVDRISASTVLMRHSFFLLIHGRAKACTYYSYCVARAWSWTRTEALSVHMLKDLPKFWVRSRVGSTSRIRVKALLSASCRWT